MHFTSATLFGLVATAAALPLNLIGTRQECSTDGALYCYGENQFALCNAGTAVWQAVAAGTVCVCDGSNCSIAAAGSASAAGSGSAPVSSSPAVSTSAATTSTTATADAPGVFKETAAAVVTAQLSSSAPSQPAPPSSAPTSPAPAAATAAPASSSPKSSGAQNVIYWGQNGGNTVEKNDLTEYCSAESGVDIVVLAFLFQYGNGNTIPSGSIGQSCVISQSGEGQNCDSLASAISTCQQNGVKVIMSLGGATGSYSLSSQAEAETIGQNLWEAYGNTKGGSVPRPFGSTFVNGFDLDIESNAGNQYYQYMIAKLRSNFASDAGNEYYITGAPQCPIPEPNMNQIITTSQFDYLFVQFYNNPGCSVGGSSDINFADWKKNIAGTPSKDAKIFIGVPASTLASTGTETGAKFYVAPTGLVGLIDQYAGDAAFGGVMLWSAGFSDSNVVGGCNYAQQVKSILESGSPCSNGPLSGGSKTEAKVAVPPPQSESVAPAATTAAAAAASAAPTSAPGASSASPSGNVITAGTGFGTYYYDVEQTQSCGADFASMNSGPVECGGATSMSLSQINSNYLVAMNHTQLAADPSLYCGKRVVVSVNGVKSDLPLFIGDGCERCGTGSSLSTEWVATGAPGLDFSYSVLSELSSEACNDGHIDITWEIVDETLFDFPAA